MKLDTVASCMTSPAYYVDTTTPIREVAHLMKDKNIGFVPIVKDDYLVGVVTDRDIVIRGITNDILDENIESIMSSYDVMTLWPDTSIKEAAEIMARYMISRLVVTYNGKIIGVVSAKNLLEADNYSITMTKLFYQNKNNPAYQIYTQDNKLYSVRVDTFRL